MAGHRPDIIINCAASADGRLALADGRQFRISSEEDMARVPRLRNSADAVLVGIGTVLKDDPKLTVKEKYIEGEVREPVRVVLDSHGRTPKNAQVLNGAAKTIIATNKECTAEFKNAEVIRCGPEKVNIPCLLEKLYTMGIRRLMVEGGSTVIGSFVKEGLFDELDIYYGSILLGSEGPTITAGFSSFSGEDAVRLELVSVERLGDGVLHRYGPAGRD